MIDDLFLVVLEFNYDDLLQSGCQRPFCSNPQLGMRKELELCHSTEQIGPIYNIVLKHSSATLPLEDMYLIYSVI